MSKFYVQWYSCTLIKLLKILKIIYKTTTQNGKEILNQCIVNPENILITLMFNLEFFLTKLQLFQTHYHTCFTA